MRLIDADKMKIGISEQTRTDSEASLFIEIIDGEPTVCDLNEMIDRIEDAIEETTENSHRFCGSVEAKHCAQFGGCEDCVADQIIKIIKGFGGIS